jgi:CHAT domain-containing protein
MRAIAIFIALLLAACEKPPPSAYLSSGRGETSSAAQVSIGNNAVGEACTQIASGREGADIFCGAWQQPSARVRAGGPATPDSLPGLATASTWRAAIDTRFLCNPPQPTTILGGNTALLMQCTRRIGGWPQVAMVALVDGQAWLADGVLPATPVMERSIGVLSGKLQADAAPPASGAAALLADRLAAKAFSSGDINQYEQLMEAGTRANMSDNPVAAERAFRAALALQEKALGRDNPNTATPMTYLALQVSDQGRYVDAAALFDRATPLAPRSSDPIAVARLLHYRALDQLNQDHPKEALALLSQAEAAYTAVAPPDALRSRPATGGLQFARGGSLSDLLPNESLLTDPAARAALLGLVEVRRYGGIALRQLGRTAEGDAAIRSALDLARSNNLAPALLTARLYRSGAMTAASENQSDAALDAFSRSSLAFGRALPDSKPLADTILLRARQLARADRPGDALTACRQAMKILSDIKAGTEAGLLAPCLDVYAGEAGKSGADRQGLLAEMFIASQLAQGGITSQQIAQATARLAENARDPRVAEAIRKREDAATELATLYRERDDRAQAEGGRKAELAEYDKKIADAQTALADADAAVQAASPNYGQLVQQVVPASVVQGALRPDEAFAVITLTDTGGWTFLVRPKSLDVGKVAGGLKRMAELVKAVRASIELNDRGVPVFDPASAQELYSSTLASVEPSLAGVRALTIAPTGPLLSLPFEVLLTGPADPAHLADAPWLVRKYVISHVPSASNFVSLRKVASGARGTQPWFGFGDFHPITLAQATKTFPGSSCAESARLLASLPALPFAKRELEVARLLLGAPVSDQLLGAAFTSAAVQKTQLKNFRILQFSTHALLPAELRCETEPAIVTSAPAGAQDASGALLTASEVAAMDLDADLVILSACNSGGPGGTTAGESLSGLARSFFYAGARALLVTHWSVNDQTAAFLVSDTLRRLRAKPEDGIAAALRDAQLGMLAEAGHGMVADVAHPFYWAPFAVIGEGGGRGPSS